MDEVLSGQDKLGSSTLHALADGRFTSTRPRSMPPGADACCVDLPASATDVEVKASIRRSFDYGILARRIKPDTDLQGLLASRWTSRRAPTLDTLMQHANGRIDRRVAA